MLGTNYLSKELNSIMCDALLETLKLSSLLAKAYSDTCIDGSNSNYKDNDGLKYECPQAKEFGFDGKSIMRPNQISIVNGMFCPSYDETLLARKYVDTYELYEKVTA